MEIQFNVTGARRKELVNAVSEITENPAVYKGAPTFAYEIGGFTVDKSGMPLEGFTDAALENLERLIAGKSTLIKKAIGAVALPVERTETTLKFPWFSFNATGDEVNAYSRFIGTLCAAAKEQKRVTVREKPVENEKFAFRVFLIRLGFVGDEYKTARKILLKNLSGNSAFKNGAPPKAEVPDE